MDKLPIKSKFVQNITDKDKKQDTEISNRKMREIVDRECGF